MTLNPQYDDYLPFEAPLAEIESRIQQLLENTGESQGLREQAQLMQEQLLETKRRFYEKLTPWQTVQLARHTKRPQTRDYIEKMLDGFTELHGDRSFRDDLAVITGLGHLGRHRFMFIGQHKGRDVNERHLCHAGCPHPEGYRKALLKMRLAERFHLPVVCFIDTKGAYPGIGAEERGQGIALAENIRDMSNLRVPVVCVIIGEGGSGGALALGVGDRILMLKYAYYSVISPEGCASILWRDGEKKDRAAEVLKLTSQDLLARGFVDAIVPEPLGGGHRDPEVMMQTLRGALIATIDEITATPIETLLEQRYRKFRSMGEFVEHADPADFIPPEPEPEPESAVAEPESQNDDGNDETTAAAGDESADASEDDGNDESTAAAGDESADTSEDDGNDETEDEPSGDDVDEAPGEVAAETVETEEERPA